MTPPDQPNDRGICGDLIWTAGVTPTRCTLLADHSGWHQNDDGTSWNLKPGTTWTPETLMPDNELDCADELAELRDERDAAYERGVADGRRQATEGWDRHRGVDTAPGVRLAADEADAHEWAALPGWGGVVSRLVGPWEPTELQPRPVREGDALGVTDVQRADVHKTFGDLGDRLAGPWKPHAVGDR